jgi:hypothetical protein
MHDQFISRLKWLSAEEFNDLLVRQPQREQGGVIAKGS